MLNTNERTAWTVTDYRNTRATTFTAHRWLPSNPSYFGGVGFRTILRAPFANFAVGLSSHY